jgi:Kef-type K+ transport system membrane component KefB
MQAHAALFHKSPLEIALFGAFQLSVVFAVAWFGTRGRPDEFRLSRVIGLTVACLATALPFVLVAFWLWPWDLEPKHIRITISSALLLAFFTPLTTAYILAIIRKGKMLRKHEDSETQRRSNERAGGQGGIPFLFHIARARPALPHHDRSPR